MWVDAPSYCQAPSCRHAFENKLGITLSNVVPLSQRGRIAGRWKFRDGFSDIEFSITTQGDELGVVVVDTSDGERPEVFGVEWKEKDLSLSFAVHWANGRFQKYRVEIGPDMERVVATIATTVQELWERQ